MATETFGLLFLEPGPNDLVGPPVSHVYVKQSSRIDYRGINKDLRPLTPQAVSSQELGSYIDKMCEELQDIKRVATRKYETAKERLRGGRESN